MIRIAVMQFSPTFHVDNWSIVTSLEEVVDRVNNDDMHILAYDDHSQILSDRVLRDILMHVIEKSCQVLIVENHRLDFFFENMKIYHQDVIFGDILSSHILALSHITSAVCELQSAVLMRRYNRSLSDSNLTAIFATREESSAINGSSLLFLSTSKSRYSWLASIHVISGALKSARMIYQIDRALSLINQTIGRGRHFAITIYESGHYEIILDSDHAPFHESNLKMIRIFTTSADEFSAIEVRITSCDQNYHESTIFHGRLNSVNFAPVPALVNCTNLFSGFLYESQPNPQKFDYGPRLTTQQAQLINTAFDLFGSPQQFFKYSADCTRLASFDNFHDQGAKIIHIQHLSTSVKYRSSAD